MTTTPNTASEAMRELRKSLERFKRSADNWNLDEYKSGAGLLAKAAEDLLSAFPTAAAPGEEKFQARVAPWMQACFGEAIAKDVRERGDRFLEEALELLQANGYDRTRVETLVDYVWSRPVGEPSQEVGGVMVTLAAYCLATGLDMHVAGETELARIWTKVEQIRAKQATKRGLHTPLPTAHPQLAGEETVALPHGWDAAMSDQNDRGVSLLDSAVEYAAEQAAKCTARCDFRAWERELKLMKRLRTLLRDSTPSIAGQTHSAEAAWTDADDAGLDDAVDAFRNEFETDVDPETGRSSNNMRSAMRLAIESYQRTSHRPVTHSAPGGDEAIECHGLDTPERVCFYEQDFYVLSNFSSFSLEWHDYAFASSEAAYHFEKFVSTNITIAEAIWRAPSAHEAFKIAEQRKGERRPDWDNVKVDIMRDILRAKAHQHEYVRRKLLATGNRELVENSWRDSYWGWGPNRDGLNMLGKLWMEVRAQLRAIDAAITARGEAT